MVATKTKKGSGKKDAAKKKDKDPGEATAGKREAARKEREEAAAAAEKEALELGDLIVKGDARFTASQGAGKVYVVVGGILPTLRKATEVPVSVAELADSLDYKYPEDLAPAFHVLEHLGFVRKFALRTGGTGRATPAYLWVGDE